MTSDLRRFWSYVEEDPRAYAFVVAGSVASGLAEFLGVSALIPMVAYFLGEPVPNLPGWVIKVFAGAPPLVVGLVYCSVVVLQTGIALWSERRFVGQMARWRTELSVEYVRSVLGAGFEHRRALSPGEMEVMITRSIGFAMKIRHRTAVFLSDNVLAAFYVLLALLVSPFTFLLFVAVAGVYAGINRLTLALRMEHSRTAKDRYLAAARHIAEYTADTRSLLTYEPPEFLARIESELHAASEAQRSTDVINVFTKLIHQPVMLVLIAACVAVVRGLLGLESSLILVMLYMFYRAAPKLIEAARGYGEIVGDSPADVTPEIDRWRRLAEALPPAGRVVPADVSIQLEGARVELEGRVLFEDLSLSVPSGSFVLVRGESGVGKSTVLDVLCGFVPVASGGFRIGGVDGGSVDFARFRIEKVALVRPESVVISGSIRENIAYLNPAVDARRIEEVSRGLRLGDFLGGRSGLETRLDPRGGNLSAGQRQRLVLARALAKAPSLLLLDEPTSNLDPQTEMDVLAALKTLRGRVTVVAVSHQPALESLADAVYLLGGGRATRVR